MTRLVHIAAVLIGLATSVAGGNALARDRDPAPARAERLRPDGYRLDQPGEASRADYRRYRLRPPPRGYIWVRMGGGFALVALSDGRTFDRVPTLNAPPTPELRGFRQRR